jgi:hypothetical protein
MLLIVESLELRRQLNDTRGIAGCFEGLAHLAVGTDDPVRAGRLLAAAGALREGLSAPLSPGEQRRVDTTVAAIRAALDPAVWARTWADGAAMSLQEAIDFALDTPASTR